MGNSIINDTNNSNSISNIIILIVWRWGQLPVHERELLQPLLLLLLQLYK